MIVNLTCRYDEKQPTGNYANRSASCAVELSALEAPDQKVVMTKARELFSLVRTAVDEQLSGGAKAEAPVPSPSNGGNGNTPAATGPANGNGNGHARRSYGRPAVPPSDKQKGLLSRICRERSLQPETIRQICERVAGCRLEQLDRKGFSRLLENLMSEEVAR